MENFTGSVSSSSLNPTYLSASMLSLSSSPLQSPQISPRSRTFNRGACRCDCKCYERSNYATLAPHKPVFVDKKMITLCKHFSECPFRGKSCEYPKTFSSSGDNHKEDNSDLTYSILPENSKLHSIEEDIAQSDQSDTTTNNEGIVRCSSFTFNITKN
jgi:hypothetical protein